MSFCSLAACRQGCTTSSSLISKSRIPLFSTTLAPSSLSSFQTKKTITYWNVLNKGRLKKRARKRESIFFPPTSKSNVSRRIRVASFEAWGSVAICLVHSDTVFVSLVVRGSAALISTSAASHTYTGHNQMQASYNNLFECWKYFDERQKKIVHSFISW